VLGGKKQTGGRGDKRKQRKRFAFEYIDCAEELIALKKETLPTTFDAQFAFDWRPSNLNLDLNNKEYPRIV
jgi:hypothetical protein